MNTLIKINTIIKRINVITALEQNEEIKFLSDLIDHKSVRSIGFVNAHAVNLAVKNEAYLNDLLDCDSLYRDGVGVELLYRVCNNYGVPGLNMHGTDLIPKLVDVAIEKGFNVYFFGSTDTVLKKLACRLKSKNVYFMNGYLEDHEYMNNSINGNKCLFVLGMGMPKQERIARLLKRKYLTDESCTTILCGGAVIDFMSGNVSRAPNILIALKCEWMYRLYLEPRRLFYRYVIGNPLFMFRILQMKNIELSRGDKPNEDK